MNLNCPYCNTLLKMSDGPGDYDCPDCEQTFRLDDNGTVEVLKDTAAMKAAKEAVFEAVRYLKSCGIRVPKFHLTADRTLIKGISCVDFKNGYRLNMRYYPTQFSRRWFAMHEVGHLLWAEHNPLRCKSFKKHFGPPQPRNYNAIVSAQAWKTPCTGYMSRIPGFHRPQGQPSWYGKTGGGEERFCELIGFMYANYKCFKTASPQDLEELWNDCWEYGLSKMT